VILVGRSLTKRFGSEVAVDGADVGVGPGEVVGLLGANGAGKTTLIRMVLGLVEPSAGEVLLFDRPPSRETRRRIGYVPQGLGLYDDLTVEENLAFTAAAYGQRREDAVGWTENLRGASGRLVGDLSLGLQRRAAFAAALSHRPDLLLLDEPTSGVDPLARERLWDEVRAAAEGGAGVLVTTHHMEEAAYCDRLVVLVSGRVAATGTMREIIGSATAVEVRSDRWVEAFTVLRSAGLPVALAGRKLRVPGADPWAVRSALEQGGVGADASWVPATFEETFVMLATRKAAF
jgi:ABC-2 type transport system ATP-binding protein/ribosome-dependent ATPase